MRIEFEQGTSLEAVRSMSTAYWNECFEYVPQSGTLIWKRRPRHHFLTECGWKKFNSRFAGTKVGYTSKKQNRSYVKMTLLDTIYKLQLAHIVWAMFGNTVPEGQVVDHKDGNPSNDRIDNLRSAPHRRNSQNHKRHSRNKSGVTGVRWMKKRKVWRAELAANGVRYHLGEFDKFDDAVAARLAAEKEHFGEYTRQITETPYELTPEDEQWVNAIGNL